MRRLAAAAIGACLVARGATAEATERQWHAGISLGWASLDDRDTSWNGLGGGLHLTYGLSDAFDALLEARVMAHPGGELLDVSGGIGAGYVLDVLSWVPRVGLLFEVHELVGLADGCDVDPAAAPCRRTLIGGAIPFGLEYLITPSFAVGAWGRYTLLFLGEAPQSIFSAGARAEIVWGG